MHRNHWAALLERWRPLLVPTAFFAAVIYYEELFLKLYCFRAIGPAGALFTFLFTLPLACLMGLLCGSLAPKLARVLLPACVALISLWIGAQTVYYHLFKTFMTVFSLTKMGMVAGAFGDMAVGQILLNWFPILMMAAPVILSWVFRDKLIGGPPNIKGDKRRWVALAAAIQLVSMGIVMLCDGGVLSLRYIYTQAAVPELEVQCFGLFTQTQLEARRVIFGIDPDEKTPEPEPEPEPQPEPEPTPELEPQPSPVPVGDNVLDINFDALLARDGEDEELTRMHQYFAQQEPTAKNSWTGKFAGKNLVWVVAEGFCTQAMDPVRTPTLWKLSHQGVVCDNFYTPLWGVSTSDGEYVTTTGLVPKSGVWSYSESSENYMPFGFGNQLRKQGYRTLAYHDYLYDYYDRNLSHPNMGYDYYAVGHGLDVEEVWPPSDVEMMEKIVPRFVGEEQFMVYCLTVSGHLKYSFEENAMAQRHRDAVAGLTGYSEPVQAYLACQMELELAMKSLVEQLDAAGRLEDTVIVLSGDHYPYGLTDEEYSQLLGHPVDPVFEIFESTLILWSADIKEPVHVEKYCSSLDVMPTLANLFGLEYDSRLMAGRDILSDTPGLVIFANYSFLNREGAYNSVTDQFVRWDGQPPDEGEVAQLVAEVQNRVAYSAAILDNDYYRVALSAPATRPTPEG